MLTVFIDTNIISGIFFSGLEAEILDSRELKLVTADICRKDTLEVVERKLDELSSRSLEKVLDEMDEALMDINVIDEEEYKEKLDEAERYVEGENDRKVLAAVLKVGADHFITGDEDLRDKEVEERVDMLKSRDLLEKMGS